MDDRIKVYKNQLAEVKRAIKIDICGYLKDCNYNTTSDTFVKIELESLADLSKVPSGAGFYIILTNKIFADNKCTFTLLTTTAIYRGHCCNVKNRIMSHLFTTHFKKNVRTKKHFTNYTVCLKIEDGVNGIDIDSKEYSKYNWTVLVHKMNGSSALMRQQAELAFDELFKKPIKSREKLTIQKKPYLIKNEK